MKHARGLAVELGGLSTVDDVPDPTYLWLQAHAASYGWNHATAMRPRRGGPLGPWHWEFGIESRRGRCLHACAVRLRGTWLASDATGT